MINQSDDLKKEIEKYVEHLHWDENSKIYAFELGKFLFSFMFYLDDQNLSERTVRDHHSNIGLIGAFEMGYGYNDEFFPDNLENGPNFLYEFKRKVSNSKYAIQSYKSTWRKLDKFIKSEAYILYLDIIESKIKNVESK